MTAEHDDGIKWIFTWPGFDEHPRERNLESNTGKDVVEGCSVWALENESGIGVELGKLGMYLTTEEKVKVTKELGVVFYPDPRDCPPLTDLNPARNVSSKAPIEQTING
ncbi:hypothetical protein H112_00061 [Trichophyton rubrum D6]|uniref:Uncharacterized protein n=5 Tax=Trichophyton TaxID=5550 RepID=A0A178F8J0_TRIRU|nr:uncharacterized protein TERG_08616 [Trichophyton rubrum CBS 118892]EZF28037.1 hypothetical protein H100_00059 [Trichophyton rubrum MR850]EZF47101.1 hypothetical protein H102_00058 [Trichophyton rubrum CBS 100081]EZF57752.1 hypothetical protein H103_00060 [Trichophyton rubrum CBS 288.86]EZF68323.1 hypothetical protein H104_00058 [Trichophyton rubrum CBS 289.86]EZF78331.1 hypothetical protein H105_00619 [Trichophyton soudanense CBS 452.61]EZF89630.1 hypothetical protein H110_00059 [Trichophy